MTRNLPPIKSSKVAAISRAAYALQNAKDARSAERLGREVEGGFGDQAEIRASVRFWAESFRYWADSAVN